MGREAGEAGGVAAEAGARLEDLRTTGEQRREPLVAVEPVALVVPGVLRGDALVDVLSTLDGSSSTEKMLSPPSA